MPARHSPVRCAGPAADRSGPRRHGCRARKPRRFALQRAQQPHQHRVLHAVARNCPRGRRGDSSSGHMRHLGRVQRPARARRMVQPVGQPSRSRSIAAHATITALSVQSRIGGASRAKPCVAARLLQRGADRRFAATPPATTRREPMRCVPRGEHRPSRSRRGRPAPPRPRAGTRPRCRRRRRAAARRPDSCATSCATAVLRPEKLKSQPERPNIGRGSRYRAGSPVAASRSTARAAGPAEPEQFRDLVERLADRIVDGPPKPAIVARRRATRRLAMAAGHQQQQIRKRHLRGEQAGQARGERMRLEMIDRDERQRPAPARCPWRIRCRRSGRRSAPARRSPPPPRDRADSNALARAGRRRRSRADGRDARARRSPAPPRRTPRAHSGLAPPRPGSAVGGQHGGRGLVAGGLDAENRTSRRATRDRSRRRDRRHSELSILAAWF